uniref:Uncharacterized protein n=1 Tax=Chenopodium quinoa TaxID=63459 RepID=A0A803MJZ5_CHEQI
MKFNEQFTMARGNILMMQSLVLVNHAYRLLIQEERHKSVVNSLHSRVETHALMADKGSNEPYAFIADKRNFDNRYRNQNSQIGKVNFRYQDRNKGRFDTRRPSQFFCDHSKILGRIIDKCFKLHGYPRDFEQNNKRYANFAQGGEVNSDADEVVTSSFTWISIVSSKNSWKARMIIVYRKLIMTVQKKTLQHFWQQENNQLIAIVAFANHQDDAENKAKPFHLRLGHLPYSQLRLIDIVCN